MTTGQVWQIVERLHCLGFSVPIWVFGCLYEIFQKNSLAALDLAYIHQSWVVHL